jgi:hypothetical protein
MFTLSNINRGRIQTHSLVIFIILHIASTDICFSGSLMKLKKICLVSVFKCKLFFSGYKFIACALNFTKVKC